MLHHLAGLNLETAHDGPRSWIISRRPSLCPVFSVSWRPSCCQPHRCGDRDQKKTTRRSTVNERASIAVRNGLTGEVERPKEIEITVCMWLEQEGFDLTLVLDASWLFLHVLFLCFAASSHASQLCGCKKNHQKQLIHVKPHEIPPWDGLKHLRSWNWKLLSTSTTKQAWDEILCLQGEQLAKHHHFFIFFSWLVKSGEWSKRFR